MDKILYQENTEQEDRTIFIHGPCKTTGHFSFFFYEANFFFTKQMEIIHQDLFKTKDKRIKKLIDRKSRFL